MALCDLVVLRVFRILISIIGNDKSKNHVFREMSKQVAHARFKNSFVVKVFFHGTDVRRCKPM